MIGGKIMSCSPSINARGENVKESGSDSCELFDASLTRYKGSRLGSQPFTASARLNRGRGKHEYHTAYIDSSSLR